MRKQHTNIKKWTEYDIDIAQKACLSLLMQYKKHIEKNTIPRYRDMLIKSFWKFFNEYLHCRKILELMNILNSIPNF